MKTPEQIVDQVIETYGQASKRGINKLFRAQDDSHLWPINGKFNATERAIRKAREFQRDYGAIEGLEYACLLDELISVIVNDPKNQ